MGLFRCSHMVRMDDMQEIKFEPTMYLGADWAQTVGVAVEYKGHCERCHAFVHLKETVENRALYTILMRQKKEQSK